MVFFPFQGLDPLRREPVLAQCRQVREVHDKIAPLQSAVGRGFAIYLQFWTLRSLLVTLRGVFSKL